MRFHTCGALFSASELNGSLKYQALLASVKHQCWEANIWEPFFFGARTGVWIKSSLSQLLNKDEIQVYKAYLQAAYLYIFNICLKKKHWSITSWNAELNTQQKQTFKTCLPSGLSSTVVTIQYTEPRKPSPWGVKGLLSLDKSLHFFRSETHLLDSMPKAWKYVNGYFHLTFRVEESEYS